MAIASAVIRRVTADLYEWALKKVPDDTLDALRVAQGSERSATGRRTLTIMLESADAAERRSSLVCTDVGIPVYSLKVGTRVRFEGPVRQAIVDGFADLVARIDPPILKMVTHPLTHERGHRGKDIPIVSVDLVDEADHLEIACAPKAMGTGRWEAMRTFVYPAVHEVERFVLDTVVQAGSQACPPMVVGVGIGGTFDHAARLAKESVLRPVGSRHADPQIEAMERRLLGAINQLGFGPMGTGGEATAVAVHVDYSGSHGFVPVAVSLNCWINRRTRARIDGEGRVERLE